MRRKKDHVVPDPADFEKLATRIEFAAALAAPLVEALRTHAFEARRSECEHCADLSDLVSKEIVEIFWLYGKHSVDSRGVAGKLMDCLRACAPHIAKELENGEDASEVAQRHWNEE